MKLYDHNGRVLQIIHFKESMGFVPTLVPILEEDDGEDNIDGEKEYISTEVLGIFVGADATDWIEEDE